MNSRIPDFADFVTIFFGLILLLIRTAVLELRAASSRPFAAVRRTGPLVDIHESRHHHGDCSMA